MTVPCIHCRHYDTSGQQGGGKAAKMVALGYGVCAKGDAWRFYPQGYRSECGKFERKQEGVK